MFTIFVLQLSPSSTLISLFSHNSFCMFLLFLLAHLGMWGDRSPIRGEKSNITHFIAMFNYNFRVIFVSFGISFLFLFYLPPLSSFSLSPIFFYIFGAKRGGSATMATALYLTTLGMVYNSYIIFSYSIEVCHRNLCVYFSKFSQICTKIGANLPNNV